VVLVAPPRVLPFCFHHSDDTKRQFAHPDYLSDRVRSGVETFRNGLAQYDDARGGSDVGFGEELAARHIPLLDLRTLFGYSLDLSVPILIAEDQLRARVDGRAGHGHARDFAPDGFDVFDRQPI